jgi:hypothetical protein
MDQTKYPERTRDFSPAEVQNGNILSKSQKFLRN